MKFKLYPDGFWFEVIFVLPFVVLVVCVILALTYRLGMAESVLAWVVFSVVLSLHLAFLFVRRKDYFSCISIDEKGLSARLFGKQWFCADWSEVKFIGRMRRTHIKGFQECLYFAKKPVCLKELKKRKLFGLVPAGRVLEGDGLFVQTVGDFLKGGAFLNALEQYVDVDNIPYEGSFPMYRLM